MLREQRVRPVVDGITVKLLKHGIKRQAIGIGITGPRECHQRLLERRADLRSDEIAPEAGNERIRAVDVRTREAEVETERTRHRRQQGRAARIRKQTDRDLGHRDSGGFGDHAMTRRGQQPEAAAHDHARSEHSTGFGKQWIR